MADLSTADRKRLRPAQFAYVDSKGAEHLPIHDESHVRNAVDRFDQTTFESPAARGRARRTILSAAKKYGIDIDRESAILRSAGKRRAGSTTARTEDRRKTL